MRGGLGGRIRQFLADCSGNMAMLFSAAFLICMAAGALAVDYGALGFERRNAQRLVDLAAIAATADPASARQTVAAMLEEAGVIGPGQGVAPRLVVEPGRYDPALPVGSRFSAAQSPPNAVRVRLSQPGTLHFAKSLFPAPQIGVEAIASTTPEVTFSIGSRLASLQDGVANAVLNGLLGTKVSLRAVDYNGLLNTKISLLPMLDALAARLEITGGTYEQLLDVRADHGDLAHAIAEVTTGAAQAAARTIAQAAGHNGSFALNRLLDLGSLGQLTIGDGSQAVVLAQLSALEVLAAAAVLGDGNHQVGLNLGANIPGLTSMTLRLAVGEPPQGVTWFAVGPSGTLVRTAQVRLRISVQLAGGVLLLGAGVSLPLYLEVAHGEARVLSASCPVGAATHGAARLAVTPGIARLSVGEVSNETLGDFAATPNPQQATLINLIALKVIGRGAANVGATRATELSFSNVDILSGTVKTATTTTPTQSLTQSLLSNLQLDIALGPLVLTPKTLIESALRALLTPVGPVLDATLVALLNALGIRLGEVDTQVYGVKCSRAVLVG